MKRFGILIACLFVAACGFRPLYQSGTTLAGDNGTVLDSVAIEDIAGVSGAGIQMKNDLMDRFYHHGYPESPRYILKVTLSEVQRDIVIRKDDVTTRRQTVMMASYELIDKTTRQKVDTGSIRAVTAYNVLQSQYTTTVTWAQSRELAVRELADKITTRMAVVLDKKQ